MIRSHLVPTLSSAVTVVLVVGQARALVIHLSRALGRIVGKLFAFLLTAIPCARLLWGRRIRPTDDWLGHAAFSFGFLASSSAAALAAASSAAFLISASRLATASAYSAS